METAALKSCEDYVWGYGTKAVEAIKHDLGKPRYDLIPANVLDGLAHMYTLGAEKYGDYNWAKGMSWHRVFRALLSHVWKWWRGERYDGTDGQHHLLSVIWCGMTLYAYDARGIGTDDRPKIENFNPQFWRKPANDETPATPQ